MKTTVIHHSADYDGIFCREIARKFLPDSELIGWDFADPPLAVPEGKIVVMDLPLDAPFGGKTGEFNLGIVMAHQEGRLVWIDHHKSAIESHSIDTAGYRIDGVAACRLAWQFFRLNWDEGLVVTVPGRQNYIDRKVEEPLAVRLAGEYDIWDKRDSRVDTFQYALRLGNPNWSVLLDPEHNDSEVLVTKMLVEGEVAQRYSKKIDSDLVTYKSFKLSWEGLNFLCLNTGRFNSLTFEALDKPETGHDALLGFMWNGKIWTTSLYHAKHRKDLDLSQIAVKHGGGGHKGACGFTSKSLPFLPP